MTVQLTDEVYWLNPAHEVMDGTEVVEGTFVHDSSYLIANERGGNIIIDTGSYLDREELTVEVDALTDGEGIASIFLTHQDLPHTANIWEFFDEGTEIVSSASKPDHQGLVPWGEGMRKIALGTAMNIENRLVDTVAPPILDRPNSTWAYDQDSDVLFTADGFGHYHNAGESDHTSREIDGGISVENIQAYHEDNLPWMRFIIAEKLREALEALLDEYQPTWVAPIHGNPIHSDDLDQYLDRFSQSVRNIYESYPDPDSPNPALHSG